MTGFESRAGDWVTTFNYAGFFGNYSVGPIYEINERHQFEISAGIYKVENHDYTQINTAYRYSPWHIPWHERMWDPFEVGLFTVFSTDRRYFLTSPNKYPYGGYYDETALRYGIEFDSTLAFENRHFEVTYRLCILDSGLVAIYNNAHRDLQYYLSSGLAVHYRF